MEPRGSLPHSQDRVRQTSKEMEKLFFSTVDTHCNADVGASFNTHVISEDNIYLISESLFFMYEYNYPVTKIC
jgi:hypothetical protein